MIHRREISSGFLVGFNSHAAPHTRPVILLVFFFFFFPPCSFWWKHYIKDQTQRFLLSFSDSTCYTVFVLIFVLFPKLSLLLHSPSTAAILNSALSLTSLFGCAKGEFKVTLKYQTSCEVDHTCVWCHSLKTLYVEIVLPFSLLFFCATQLVLSGLIWSQRGEVRPHGDEAMLIMWHRIWCVWSEAGPLISN